MVILKTENRCTPKTSTVTVRPLQIVRGLAYDRIRTRIPATNSLGHNATLKPLLRS